MHVCHHLYIPIHDMYIGMHNIHLYGTSIASVGQVLQRFKERMTEKYIYWAETIKLEMCSVSTNGEQASPAIA